MQGPWMTGQYFKMSHWTGVCDLANKMIICSLRPSTNKSISGQNN